MSPPQIRAYAHVCSECGHGWLKITETEGPDKVCPYYHHPNVQTTIVWAYTYPRSSENGG